MTNQEQSERKTNYSQRNTAPPCQKWEKEKEEEGVLPTYGRGKCLTFIADNLWGSASFFFLSLLERIPSAANHYQPTPHMWYSRKKKLYSYVKRYNTHYHALQFFTTHNCNFYIYSLWLYAPFFLMVIQRENKRRKLKKCISRKKYSVCIVPPSRASWLSCLSFAICLFALWEARDTFFLKTSLVGGFRRDH